MPKMRKKPVVAMPAPAGYAEPYGLPHVKWVSVIFWLHVETLNFVRL